MHIADFRGDIMCLPDWVFGRRWIVSCELSHIDKVEGFAISEDSFAENTVIWGVFFSFYCKTYLAIHTVGLRFADWLPSNDAEFQGMEVLFRGLNQNNQLNEFQTERGRMHYYTIDRLLVNTKSRRMVMRAAGNIVADYTTKAGVLVSSLPKEIPNWLVC